MSTPRVPAPLARAAAYVLAVIVAALAASVVLAELADVRLRRGFDPDELARLTPFLLASSALLGAVILAVTHLFLRRVDREPWSRLLPPEGRWRRFGAGALLGLALCGLAGGVLFAGGWLQVTGRGWASPSDGAALAGSGLATLAVILLQSAGEEVFARGYLLRALLQWRGAVVALAVTSVTFGLMHGLNPGATRVALLNTSLVGLFLGLVRLRGGLWAAIGCHAAWNFILGFVLAQPVSGIPLRGLIATRASGPSILSGGEFGPEGSLIVTGIVVLGLAAFLTQRGLAEAAARARAE
jgi:hypothetical protein